MPKAALENMQQMRILYVLRCIQYEFLYFASELHGQFARYKAQLLVKGSCDDSICYTLPTGGDSDWFIPFHLRDHFLCHMLPAENWVNCQKAKRIVFF